LKADDVVYEKFKKAFIDRFKDKHTYNYHYARIQNASHEKNESPEVFLDRLRKLCQRTIRRSNDPVEQAVINQEADRRLLAAFINGLIGVPGKQVRLHIPDHIGKALNMAIIATNAEKEEKASSREDRGATTKVFAVEPLERDPRGSRDGIPANRPLGRSGNRYESPRGKFQWSSNRGAVQTHWAGPVHDSTGGVVRTYSRRTDNRTSMGASGAVEGGAKSGPKNDDDRYAPRPRGIRCYECGLMGHMRSHCPPRRGKRLNGIWRTKAIPPSYPK